MEHTSTVLPPVATESDVLTSNLVIVHSARLVLGP
jgi:hypothetical protein